MEFLNSYLNLIVVGLCLLFGFIVKKWVKDVDNKTGKPVKEVTDIINTFLCEISESLREGTAVTIRDFGSVKLSQRSERTGRNPYSGETIVIPAKPVVTFKPASRILQYEQLYKQ